MSSFDDQLEKELEKLKKKKNEKKETVTPKRVKTNTFDDQLEAELESLKKKGRNTGNDTGKYDGYSVVTTDSSSKDIAPVKKTNVTDSVFDIAKNQQKYNQMSSVLGQASEISKKILAIDNRPKYGAAAQDDVRWNSEREMLQKELDSLVSGYGGLDKLRTQTQTLNQQLKLANYQQKGSKLASVMDANSASFDKDFSKLAKEDKSVNDDLYAFVNNRGDAQKVKFNPAQHYNNAQPMQTTPYGAMASAPVVPETNTEAVRNRYAGKGYHLLTEEEKSIFNYYWAKEGKEKAVEWLDSIQWTLNERMANQNVENIGDSVTQKILFGAQAGFDQFSTGLDSAANALRGKDEFTVPNVKQITSSLLREDLTGVGRVAYDLTTTTANMLPSILVSTAANFIVPGSGAVVGAATLGTSAGGNAYQEMINQGYDASQAKAYGLLVGGSEAVLQSVLGGITKLSGGNGGVFENLIGKALPSVENGLARFALKYGGNMLDEGLEEAVQEVLDPIFQRMVGNPDAEVDWGEVAYSALLGAMSAGVLESSSVPGAVKAYKNGVDPVTGLTKQEQSVKDKLIELETEGKTLTKNETAEIEAKVLEDMENGLVPTEIIEEVLGGENYTAYQDMVKQDNEALAELAELYEGDELKQRAEEFITNSKRNEMAKTLSDSVYDMVKDTRLGESYRDRARRGQLFQADTTQYDEKQRVTIQRAIDSGVLNNTKRTHDMVDLIARLSADTGVLFDFTNNEKLKDTIYAVNGKTVDGYITKDGITINVNSPRYINTIVGHEITHAFEGTKQYEALEKALFEYAKEKGTYKDVLKDVYELYHGEEGYEGYEGLKKIKKEAVANLVGDYLFTDKNFINHLSAKHQNIFQKVWNEVKYMVKIARAGSNEAKKLLEVQKAFEEAYRAVNAQKTTTDEGGGVTYSYSKPDFTKDEWSMVNRRKHSEFDNPKFDLDNDTKWMYFNEKGSTVFAVYSKHDAEDPTVLYGSSGKRAEIDNAKVAAYVAGGRNAKRGRGTLDRLLASIQRNEGNRSKGVANSSGTHSTIGDVSIPLEESRSDRRGDYGDGSENLRESKLTEYNEEASAEEQDASFITFSNDYAAIRNYMKEGDVGEEADTAPVKYSLSAEQKEYFKDSVVRDENGNLKVMYHGTPNGDYTIFKDGTYFTDNKEYADRYQNPGASSISTGKVASNPKTFEVYLDIKKPFDLNDAEARDIYINEYIKGGNAMGINPYLSDAEYAKIKTIDWTEGEDLREFLIDNGYDYDGLVLDEGADGGYGNDVKSRGTSYVIFSPEQAKIIDNAMPTADPDIRYSLSKDSDGKQLTNEQIEYFKDSKVVDENGSLKVMYHGTSRGGHTVFDPWGKSNYGLFGTGSYFTDSKSIAESYTKKGKGTNPQIYETYLNITNPLDMDAPADPAKWANAFDEVDFPESGTNEEFYRAVEEYYADQYMPKWEVAEIIRESIEFGMGYDGITHIGGGRVNPDGERHRVYIAFNPEQVKNIDNVKPTAEQDIRYSLSKDSETPMDQRLSGDDLLNAEDLIAEIEGIAEISPNGYVTVYHRTTEENAKRIKASGKMSAKEDGIFFSTQKDGEYSTDYGKGIVKLRVPVEKFVIDDIFDTEAHLRIPLENRKATLDVSKYIVDDQDSYSISKKDYKPTTYGNWHISGKDVAYEEIAPVAETVSKTESVAPVEAVSKTETTTEELFPDDREELTNLLSHQFELRGALESAVAMGDTNTMSMLTQEYEDITARIRELEAQEAERFNSIDDANAPPEMDAPYFGESDPATVENPFDDRDWYKVGNQKVKAYMYENPEVKPFFQDEALALMTELRDTTKGEKFYSEEAFMVGGNEEAWTGVKRHTSKSIETLLDDWGMSYADIEKGLNAIIEDNGAENIAAAKKIEFMLNDRLLNGYTDFYSNSFVSPNQEYINLLEEMQINEYSEEAFAKFMETADQYAPIADDDIAPVAQPVAPAKTAKEEYLAVTPKLTKEPKMVRVDAPFDPKTANILTEEPKVQKKKSGLWSMFKENVLDNGMVFEDLALKTKNRDLQAKWNFIRYSQSRAQKLIGDGADGVRSLNSIREEVEKSGKTQKFYEYLYHWLNVDRMTLENRFEDTPNKAVFGDSVTADMSRVAAVQLGKENPEFRSWARDVYRYNSHLRKLMVDKGIISQETADLWAEMYPHYVPIRRFDDAGLNIDVPLDTRKTGVNAPIKKATGGNSDILPLFDTMAQRTLQTYKAIAKNSFGVELKNTLGTTITKEQTDVDGIIDSIDNHDGLLQEGKNGNLPTFTVFENGERVTFEITDEMYNAMKPAGDLMSATIPVLNKASNFHRGLLTEYNPVFMTTNAIKDTQDILINSQHPAKTYANLPRATWEIAQNGKWFREYMENGGEDNSYFDSDTNSFDTEEKGVRKLLGIPPLSWISKANNFVERTPRLAEYIASREAGRSIEVSMLDAARVTTNFAAGGKLTKLANRNGATFLNASVQGAVQQARNIREAKVNGLKGWLQLAGKFVVAGLPAILLNGLMWDDDEDYEELSDYVKQNYYIVAKYGDGKFVRIPKGRTVAVIQNAVEQVMNAATGNDEVDLKSFRDLAFANLAPNNPIENNIFAPIFQVKSNKTWYGEDLVPTRLQDLPAAEQYDESTDAISKWLGEKLNLSPYKINYLLDQYSGGVGDTFLPMLTPEAESGDDSLVGNLLAPLKSKFTTDSVMNNQNVSDFYDTKDELTTNAKASGSSDEDVLMNKYMNSINAELSDLYKRKREIQNSNYPASTKYSMVRAIQNQIVDLTKESLDTYKDVSINGEYATVGDLYFKKNKDGEWQKLSDEQKTKYLITSAAGDSIYATDGNLHYRRDEEGEWTKISDTQLARQNEVTKALGITPEEYWSKTKISFIPMSSGEYEYAYDSPENYAVAKVVGGYDSYKAYSSELSNIKADKDKNGKTISGSRKDKVLDYLDGLAIDYYAKIILFKNEYNADDTYNEEIVEYLNSRDDISYQEMVTILKKLGFTVKGNTVTW